MTDSRPIQPTSFQRDVLEQAPGSSRLLLAGGILIAHALLLGLLLCLPKEAQRDAEPLPMVMVDLQPAVPLTMGTHHNASQQAVTAEKPAMAQTREDVEEAIPIAPLKSIVTPKNAAPVAIAKPVSPATSLSSPTIETATSAAASEHSITTQAAGPSGANAHSDATARTSTQVANTAGTSGAHSASLSAPQFGAGYLSNPAPEYPELARDMGEEGKVLLHVLVTPEGQAKKVKLHRTSGSGSLDEAAVKAVRKWRFVPAKLGDQAVEAWVFVPIVFKLD